MAPSALPSNSLILERLRSEKAHELKKLGPKLEALIVELGGSSKVEGEARTAWRMADDTSEGETSDMPEAEESALRRRTPAPKEEEKVVALQKGDKGANDRLEALTYHPNAELSKMAIRMAELDEALVSHGFARVGYPANLTYLNFLDFLAVPTLVYELEYPRTNVIRPLYVLEKTGALFGTFGVLIMIVEHYIIPVKPQAGDSFLKSALDLALPFMRESVGSAPSWAFPDLFDPQ